MKSRIGPISLLSTLIGLAITRVGIHSGWLQGPVWPIVASGFEAGTVGGLADWFAVSVLFREVPLPFVRQHTNILVKNRRQLTEGIVDLQYIRLNGAVVGGLAGILIALINLLLLR
ncbi:MAG: DUF445 family protein [Deltaproteobacteria bacterium]|nr:DUF445 family protein [Deltaproteobacteria bacterium]